MYNLRRRTLLLVLVPLFSLLFLLLFALTPNHNSQTTIHLHFRKHIQVAHSTCQGTLYPDLCVSTLASFPDLTSKSVPQVISSLINHTVYEVTSSSSNCSGLRNKLRNLNPLEHRGLEDCLNLLDDTLDELKTSIAHLSQTQIPSKRYHDLQTLLSGAMTNVYTCLDGFSGSKGNVRQIIEDRLFQICHHVSNTLAMLKKMPTVKKASHSDEAFPGYGKMKHGFPSWLTSKDRKLLQASVKETKFDLVVAKDGTGNFTTIGEAVAAAPNDTKTRYLVQYLTRSPAN